MMTDIKLYSELADVDSMVFCIKSQKSEDVIKIVRIFADSFCGIHLEDISAPSCFEIENALSQSLNIPVFHDDQHGTAIIVLAGLLNALYFKDRWKKYLHLAGNYANINSL